MKRLLSTLGIAALLAGCQTAPLPPMDPVRYVDLDRFMGDWYVIASIPTPLEHDIYNALESYRLNPDSSVSTTFSFNEGGSDGERKVMRPTGFVVDRQSNAVWGMQFIWPIKADYRITYLREDYGVTVIARKPRDYVWIMARSPALPEDEYEDLVRRIAAWGYDISRLRRVPQQGGWQP
jgi:apolipoprotein D and lipocalin family protein